ncbi:cyclodeaminase/cyclohydrolase family protein [Desnuesiella massiliensis]|uniref:cyclodeaminase/cyclohydrolase family protein n=1 Tax=Desnuesiella massiliensis TaxID=1650662 RepID=UPI0006E1B408|nr:cyclodeaminase/cyclohydrolase family protein [Desnuesiella massiliensis]
MLNELTIKEFINELSSNSPAPGGGSVAALSAALSAALNSMVFNLTVGKKVYNEYSDGEKEIINSSLEKSNGLKDVFLDYIEKDTEAFMEVMAAYKLPKDTEEEKNYRKNKIEESYKLALEVPRSLYLKSIELYDHIEHAVKLGNVNAVSDAGVAALLLQTAIESAVLNVKINLTSLKDDNFRSLLTKECEEVIKSGLNRRNRILDSVEKKIQG